MSRSVFVALVLLTACNRVPDREAGQYPISLSELERSAPADTPAEADYRRSCLPCHGTDGRGSGGTLAADFTAATGVLTKSDELLLVSVRDGKQGSIGTMPPHGRLLSEDQIRAVLGYVRQRFGSGIVPVVQTTDGGVDAAIAR